jgi:large subunit ribosomal protein L25
VSEVRIAAEPRTEFGKGAARRVRRAHKVPAVLYGHGDAPRHFSLPGHELMLALKHDANVLLTLETSEGDQLALPKVVVRDPLKGFLEHVDLVAVRKGEKVTVEIPVTTTGEAAAGVLVDQQTLTLTVSADATALPEGFEVDITGKQVGDSITAGDVPLPSGVDLAQAADHVMVAFLGAPTEADVEADLAAAEEELGAGAAGATTEDEVEVGSESDEAGEGDVVAETDGPKSDAE